MLRKCLSLMLSLLLLHVAPTSIHAQSETDAEAQRIETIKMNVASIGFGPDARATVKLLNGDVIKGYISYAGKDSFAVTNSETNATTPIPYADVAQVKRQKKLSGATKLLIGYFVVGAIVSIFFRNS